MVRTAAVALMLAVSAPASAETFVCHPASKQLCRPKDGCHSSVVTVWARFSPTGPGRAIYSRCDRNGCDNHDVSTYNSGAFLILELDGKAAFAKVAPDGTWTEAVSIGNEVIIAHGKCVLDATP